MADSRDSTTPQRKPKKRPETGVQRALDNVPEIKRHLRNADAHIERARREERRRTAA